MTRNTLFSTSFKEAETRFSISCLVCATRLTQYKTYGKVHWVTLDLFEEYIGILSCHGKIQTAKIICGTSMGHTSICMI